MTPIRRAGFAAVGALVALSIALPASAVSSATRTRWVDDDGRAGPSSCGQRRTASRSIQAAVNASDRNDVIKVCPGTYTGKVSITGGSRNGLTLRAVTAGTVTLRAPSNLKDGELLRVRNVSNVTVRGLTLAFPTTGCQTRPGGAVVQGIWVEAANGTDIIANRIQATGSQTQGRCGFNDGIRVRHSDAVFVDANIVRDFKRNGISFEGDSTAGRIHDNQVLFYHAASNSNDDGNQGIRVVSSSQAEVARNTVRSRSAASSDPHLEIGIRIANTATTGVNDVHHNVVRFTKTGIGNNQSASRIATNTVVGAGVSRGIHVWDDPSEFGLVPTSSEVTGNRVSGHQTGIQVDIEGTTISNNDATGNSDQGCEDNNVGAANTWTGNVGSPASSPAEICPAP